MNKISINPDSGNKIISRNIYGHFAEHLGRCIYNGFWVGRDSEIPNIDGMRLDIIEALKKICIPVLRWPGGCFADEYHWEDGIGPYESRPSIVNTHWGGVTENNHFGTHEFMRLCELLDCEPYICGNLGSGTMREMRQWVEYLTFDGKSPMADLRRQNGRDDPWKIRFWGIGNENWGCGGNMRPEFYADQYRRYATYCKNYGNNRLYKIACGANSADYKWTEILMREAAGLFDGLSLHYYTVPGTWQNKGSAVNFDQDEWFTTLKKAIFIEELIKEHSHIMDKYDPEKRIGMIIDEWGAWYDVEPGTNPGFLYQQNSLRDALVAGVSLNIFNNCCDRIFMANIAQTVNVLQAMILTENDKLVLTPTYHVFDMYKMHQDSALLPVDKKCNSYKHKDESLPAVSASASKDKNGGIHISLCNPDPDNMQYVECTLNGKKILKIQGKILTAERMNAHNTFDKPDNVKPDKFNDVNIADDRILLNLPSKSIVVLKITI